MNQLLCRIFVQRRKEGRTDLEAVETALRSALHQAGASALSELLQHDVPAADQRRARVVTLPSIGSCAPSPSSRWWAQ